jgi:putative tricarboxylic transport membrane protein
MIMNRWRNLNKSELIAAALLFVLGLSIMSQAWDWTDLTHVGPGPGFFPLWTGIAISVLSAGVVFFHIDAVFNEQTVERTSWDGSGRVFVGWAGLAVAIALLKPAGFIVSFFLLTLFLVFFVFRRRFITALAVGFGSCAGFWVVFEKLLDVQLPVGPWGF